MRKLFSILVVSLAIVGLLPAAPASAAEVATANTAEDTYRCSWGGYNSGGKYFSRGYCYFLESGSNSSSMTTLFRANVGADVSVTGGGTNQYYALDLLWRSTDAFGGPSGALTGVWEVGPQTASTGIVVPAGAAIWRTTSSTHNYNGAYAGYTRNDRTSTATMTGNFFSNGNYGGGRRSIFIGGGSSEASIDAELWTEVDHFPGSSAYSPEVAFCAAEVTWDQPLDSRIFAGDVLTFSYERTPAVTGNIDVRFHPELGWADEGGPWTTILSESVIGTSGTGSVTVGDQGWATGQFLSALDMRCRNIATDQFVYKDAGDDSNTVNDGVVRPCAATRVTWPAMATLYEGEVVSWYFSHVSIGYTGDPDVLVQYSIWDDGNYDGYGHLGSLDDLTWTTLVDLSPGEYGDYTIAAGYDGTTRQFLLRCVDDQGNFYAVPWSTASRLDNLVPANEESCYSQAGIGLRPSSWVPGLARMGSCVTRVLFVPSDESVDDLADSANLAATRAPISYIAELGPDVYASMDGAPAAVTANRNDCLVLLAGELYEGMDTASACPSALDSSTLTDIRTLLGVVAWLGFAWLLWSMTRRLIAS